MAINQSELIQKASEYSEGLHANIKAAALLGRVKSAFLCHSHMDTTLVKGLIALFNEEGVDLYIDWKDHSMPGTPNAETARKIQEAIRTRDFFLFLATANSMASRWCPWEIGYADSSLRKILIVPTSNYAGTYGNEYLELYAKIDMGTHETRSGLALFNAGTRYGEWLSEALR